MLEAAKVRLRTSGAEAAIEFLESAEDARAARDAYRGLLVHAYWDQKDLPAVVWIARAGIDCHIRAAERLDASSPDGAREARRGAQQMAYNLASFSWPGWDEPGIVPTYEDLKTGEGAARQSLELVEQLGLGDLPHARGTWMLAAHHLARGLYAEAEEGFRISAARARKADRAAEALLANGFACLARRLQSAEAPEAAEKELEHIKQELRPLKDGEEFARQIETAERLWVSRPA